MRAVVPRTIGAKNTCVTSCLLRTSTSNWSRLATAAKLSLFPFWTNSDRSGTLTLTAASFPWLVRPDATAINLPFRLRSRTAAVVDRPAIYSNTQCTTALYRKSSSPLSNNHTVHRRRRGDPSCSTPQQCSSLAGIKNQYSGHLNEWAKSSANSPILENHSTSSSKAWLGSSCLSSSYAGSHRCEKYGCQAHSFIKSSPPLSRAVTS